MKKNFLILSGLVCILLSANLAIAKEFYCSQNANMYSSNLIYDTESTVSSKCDWLNDDFFTRKDPDKKRYQECVKNYNMIKAEYGKGNCTPILSKTFSQGNLSCTVDYFQLGSRKQRITTSCTGSGDKKSLESQINNFLK